MISATEIEKWWERFSVRHPQDAKKFERIYKETWHKFQALYPDILPFQGMLADDEESSCWGAYNPELKKIRIWYNGFLASPSHVENTILHELTHAYLFQTRTEKYNGHGANFWSTFKPLNKYLLTADKYRERFKRRMESLKRGELD